MKKLLIILFLITFNLCSCELNDKRYIISPSAVVENGNLNGTSDIVVYAENFNIYPYDSGYKLEIVNNSTSRIDEFYLFDENASVPEKLNDKIVIRTPVKSVVAFSSTQWSVFQRIDELDMVKGVLESNYSANVEIINLVKEGKIVDLGTSNHVDVEKVIDLQPELILYTPYPSVDYSNLGVLSRSVMIPFPDYLESHPLGRAEWMKVVGLLCGKIRETSEWFNKVVSRYESLSNICSNVKDKPTVFSDLPFENQWYVPGGNSYIARIFSDAGGDYIWKDDKSTGSLHIDAESVLINAQNADYWRVINSYDTPFTYEKLKNDNELYPLFKAFKEKNLLVCNVKETGYFEQSQYEPDILLADFIYHFHPELLLNEWKDYKPKYFKKLMK